MNEKSSSGWLVGCVGAVAGSASASADGEDAELRSAAWFGGEDTDTMLLGEETDNSPLSSNEHGHRSDIFLCFLADKT